VQKPCYKSPPVPPGKLIPNYSKNDPKKGLFYQVLRAGKGKFANLKKDPEKGFFLMSFYIKRRRKINDGRESRAVRNPGQ
jgi:hypothetical protein